MNEMTNAQLDAYLETLAELVEAKAKSVKEAAEIIRAQKIAKEQPTPDK